MSVKFGNNDIDSLKLGSNDIDKIYFNGNTIYEKEEPVTGETWIWNASRIAFRQLSPTYEKTFDVSFTCNGVSYSSIHYATTSSGKPLGPGYIFLDYNDTTVYDYYTGWESETYRTIVLSEPASGDLLTILNGNAVKQ